MPEPRLSIVVLSWNEAANVGACLAALARQTETAVELLLIDAGSSDGTVGIVDALAPDLPFPVTVRVGPPRMPIGAARNLGVSLARAPAVAFVSADAELAPDWVQRALANLGSFDLAFSRQLHTPPSWSVAAAVRGLRYHFPTTPTREPLRLASNVAAAYRTAVLRQHPFDPTANAAEDLLLARRAHAAGSRATYDAAMVVRHRDVASLRQEFRKNSREGAAWGRHASELGALWALLAWALALVGAATLLAFQPLLGAALLAAILWAPALRRGTRHWRAVPTRYLLAGVAASPAFDLTFLVHYVRGLTQARRQRRVPQVQEIPA